MIKTFNIQPKKVEKRKSNAVFIAIIAIALAFLIAVTTTCLIVMSNKNKEKVGVGSSGGTGYRNGLYYQTIDFYDLTVNNNTFKVNASDFVV